MASSRASQEHKPDPRARPAKRRRRWLWLWLLVPLLAAWRLWSEGRPSLPISAVQTSLELPAALTDAQILAIRRGSGDLPLRDLSHYQARHAPRSPEARLNAGACAHNTRFQMGVGRADITGPAYDVVMLGYAESSQVAAGILDRQYARAFVFASQCEGRSGRVVLVQMDIGLMFNSIKQGVVDQLSRDPQLAPLYGMHNLVLNASHSHGTAGGQAFHDLTNLANGGHDAQSYQAAVDGVVRAIQRAHQDLLDQPAGQLSFAQGELLDGNVNRSRVAYQQHAERERAAFVDTSGREVDTNRMMVLLKLLREDGRSPGMLSFYAVHGTSVSELNRLLTSDNKGVAAQRFEREQAAREPGFVAGFMQADEGDVSPNLFVDTLSDAQLRDKRGAAFARRNGARSDVENALISGGKQYLRARSLYEHAAEPLRGEVAVAHQLIDMSRVRIDALARSYPAALRPEQGQVARTCKGALGVSLGGGAEDGRGPSLEGQTCFALRDLSGIARSLGHNTRALLRGVVPPGIFVPLGCGNPLYGLRGYDCHAEKPILLPLASSPFDSSQGLQAMTVPLQLVVVGNLVIIALPWEVTTMQGRRLRAAVLDVLAPAGVDYAVIAGLSNDYIHYLTTREEYALQQYEGASTVFGPWSGEAVEQELKRLAQSVRAQRAPASPYGDDQFRSHRTRYVQEPDRGDGEMAGMPGDVLVQPRARYRRAGPATLVVEAQFAGGNLRHDLQSEHSYLYVERREPSGYVTVASDADLATRFFYAVDAQGKRRVVVQWWVTPGVPQGTYRIRHQGRSEAGAYSATTRELVLE